jgi:hypothetical protein
LRKALAASLLLAALGAAGCGAGAGEAPGGASLLVTRDYGKVALLDDARPDVAGSETALRLLQRNADVKTRYGGGFVLEVDGIAGGSRDGRNTDWFFYVNGVFSEKGASAVKVRDGDLIWWDHHEWEPGVEPHAVVGAFPEPFLHGFDGQRLPVRVECAEPGAQACDRVRDALTALGVPAARAGLAMTFTKETLRVLVGPWATLRGVEEAALIGKGPASSGVFARFGGGGRSLELLDSAERPTRRLGAGAGLIAATRLPDAQPLWVVTGTDEAGVQSAAAAIGPDALRRRFAVAIDRGRPVPLPDER